MELMIMGNWNKRIIVAVLALLCLSSPAFAQGSCVTGTAGFVTSFCTVQNWFPVVAISILMGMMIAAIIYVVGYILDDHKVKSRGVSEFTQAIGTAIFTVIIIGVLIFFGSMISSNVLFNGISADITNICTVSLVHSPLGITTNSGTATQVQNEPGTSICSIVAQAKNANADPTFAMDYGLAASYAVVANLTSQDAVNFNATYTFESMIGFLSTLTDRDGIRTGPLGLACAIPVTPECTSVFVSFAPFAGDDFLRVITKPIETQMIFLFYLYNIQILLIVLALYLWPWFLAAGIIMRAIPFTRQTGGLMMAVAVVVVMILPIVILTEYAALNGGSPTITTYTNPQQPPPPQPPLPPPPACPSNSACPLKGTTTAGESSGNFIGGSPVMISFNGLLPNAELMPDSFVVTGNVVNGQVVTYNSLQTNFFIFPNATDVIRYNDCWPRGALGIPGEEVLDSASMSVFGIGYALTVVGGFLNSLPGLDSYIYNAIPCTPNNMINTSLELTKVYGIMTVSGFIIPLLNVLILIAAIRNISFLFGGDVEIAGLGRLV